MNLASPDRAALNFQASSAQVMQPMSKQRWRAHHSEPSTESISVRMHPAAVTQALRCSENTLKIEGS
jgi:hypothetical protein